MCVWLLLGWSLATLALPSRRLAWRPAATVAGAVAVAAVATAVVIGTTFTDHPYDQQRAIDQRLVRELPDGGATRVDGVSFDAATFKAGVIYALRRAGKDVVTVGAERALGRSYEAERGYQRVVAIDVGETPAPLAPGARRLARLSYRGPDGKPRTVTVDLRPAR
jgi:hypothetical protein